MNDQSISLPYTLSRNRLRIRPTRYGIVFILLLLGMFAGSINYNNNLGFLLTFLLGGIAFVSIAHTYINISGIKILSCSTAPTFSGQQAAFEIITKNPGIARTGIGFALAQGKPAILDLAAESKNRILVSVQASSRGLLRPWPLMIYSDYPLGFFRVQTQLHLDCECIVYPKPQIGDVKTVLEKSTVETNSGFSGSGTDDFQGLKGYLPGDPLQRISWKASSRGRGLFTKEFKGQYAAAFYLDWYTLKGPDTEQKLSLLCDAVLKAQKLNLNYGLKLPGKSIKPNNGKIHQHRCLKTLALFSLSQWNPTKI